MKNNSRYNQILKIGIFFILLSCIQNVMAYEYTPRQHSRDMRKLHDHMSSDPSLNQHQQPSAIDNWFGDMMGQALAQSVLNAQKLKQEKGAEFSTLRPPYEAKHSRAKRLLSGYTLIFDNNAPIWFDQNGSASSIGKSGKPYSFKWFVKADMVCMGRSKTNAKCMNFVFDKKRKTTGIKTNSGDVLETFQLVGADIKNLSKNKKK